ncbi:hypothetical protein ABPG74_004582 [Tetrahymena malaccensis]
MLLLGDKLKIEPNRSLSISFLFFEDSIYYQVLTDTEDEYTEDSQEERISLRVDCKEFLISLLICNFFTWPIKVITYIWALDQQYYGSSFISACSIISLGLDLLYLFTSDLEGQVDINQIDPPQRFDIIMTVYSLIISLKFFACVEMFIQNWNLNYFKWIYFFINILMLPLYQHQIRNKINYTLMYERYKDEDVLGIKLGWMLFFHIDVFFPIFSPSTSIIIKTFSETRKFSIIQKTVLLSFYLLHLKQSEEITNYQYFLLVLGLISILIQIIAWCIYIDILNIKHPYSIEIDNLYTLKKLIQQYERESALSQKSFFKNLQIVYIYIRYEEFKKKSDLISCLFSAFGKAEICSHQYQRKYLKQSYFQKVTIAGDIDHENLESGLKRKQILPQIRKFKTNLHFSKKQLIVEFLQQNNLIIQLKDLNHRYYIPPIQFNNIEQSMDVVTRNNIQVKYIEVTVMQILVFNYYISKVQAFNPKILYYDMYENYEKNTQKLEI